jgi:perosamine synthetase
MDAGRNGEWRDVEAFIPLAQPDLDGREREYLLKAFDSGYLTHCGEYEDRFEKDFGLWIERPALATSSGTAALHLALLSLGVGPGDEVICPVLTFGATASVIVQCGAKPVFVDVTKDYGLNWNTARKYVSRRTKAVIVVHLYGIDAGVENIGVPVIEDSCEALGMVEPRGHCAAFSFYGNKPMTTGEGGMLVGNLGNARLYRDGGFTNDYDMVVPGLNYRMTNIQAAIGCAQLERADDLVAKRLHNASLYSERLEGKGKWLFVADCDNPVAVAEVLRKHKIETRPVFRPLHMTKAFRFGGKFKVAERLWERGLCLPTGPHVTEEQITRICDLVSLHLQRPADSHNELHASV